MSSATRFICVSIFSAPRQLPTGKFAAALFGVLALSTAALAQQPIRQLRVCADPNNMPYSNQQQQGFENRLADLIGKDLNEPVTYVWYRQGEKFFDRTLNAGVCDVVMGVPSGFGEAATTEPYYRSTYVFLTRRNRHLHITSLDDPRLRTLKIGVHVLGDQNDSIPPVHALISNGIVKNLVGFSIFGRLDEANPSADLVKAVADGKVDVAIAWGPLAGYFAKESAIPLEVTPIPADRTFPNLPFYFDISLGVRENDHALRQQLNAELERRRPEIQQLLHSYGIPQVTMDNPPPNSAASRGLTEGPQAKGD